MRVPWVIRSSVPRVAVAMACVAPGFALQAQDCLGDYVITASPPPVDGTYDCGQTVTFCLTVNTWNTTNANWLQGVVASFGPGWDLNTLVPGTPPATVGGSGGTWGWYNSVTGTAGTNIGPQGPGFFFDLDNDGDPGNNFGDFATAGPWTFCWTISVASGADCVNGADLTVSINTFGDSETGGWGSEGCHDDPLVIVPATVMACPSAGIGIPQVLCDNGAPLDLFTTLGGTPDATGTWTGPGGGTVTGVVDPAAGPPGDYTYTVTPADDCPVVSATVPVTINPLPHAGTDGSIALCGTDPAADLFTVLGGAPDAGGAWTDPGNQASTGQVDPATASGGVFVYTVSGIAPCPDATAAVTVTIDHLPDPGVDHAVSMCPEAAVVDLFAQLGNQADAGGVWSGPDGTITTADFDPAHDPPGNYTYTVSGTGACAGEERTAVVHTLVFPSPDPFFTFDVDHGCTPLEVAFGLKNAGNTVSAEWTFGDGTTGTGVPDITHTYTGPGTVSVGTFVTDANGCVADTALLHIIRVYPPPSALFHFTPYPELTTDDTHLTFTAFQPELANYAWTIDHAEATGREVTYDFPYTGPGSYPVCLTVTDSIACAATLCDTIVIHDPLAVYVPNTFTPDGDGINDVWKPSLLSADPKDLSLEVYDRWGEVVFASDSPDMGWNGGMGNSSGVLPQGIYNWHLRLTNLFTAERREYFGHVSLLK